MENLNDEKLKSFLKKESKRLGISVNNVYNTYFSRILLNNISNHNEHNEVIVKGSFAQLVQLGKIVRPITDIDLASKEPHHDPLLILINAMCDETNDVDYILRGKPFTTNTGIIKIPISAKYGKISHPIGIDYRENYPFIFKKESKTVPKIFEGDEEYKVIVPSIEEILAEKLYIIIKKNKLYDLNTRVKDLYDVYQLHGGNYDLDLFSYFFEKIIEMSSHVNKDDLTTEFLSKDFVNKYEGEWEHSKKKYEFMDDDIDLEGSVYYARGVLSEQIQKIKQGKNKIYSYKIDD
jgi:predicted nucleotidyltransferase component of viral defense system